jgi:fucose 4-O-acetylase-like acetyltransferase
MTRRLSISGFRASDFETYRLNIDLAMKSIRPIALPAAVIVLVLCIYAFLLGNKVFQGKFENEPILWYILAKGIFCFVSLIATARILDVLIDRLSGPRG